VTPKGIREKSFITNRFLVRKKQEYELLRDEIIQIEQSLGFNIK